MILNAIFPALMCIAIFSDLLFWKIPNWLILILFFVFFVFAFSFGISWTNIGLHLSAGIVALLVFFVFFAAGWVGAGDAKLIAVTALWMGVKPGILYIFIFGIFGGILAAAVLVVRKKIPFEVLPQWKIISNFYNQNRAPYGVALGAAGIYCYPNTEIFNKILESGIF